jgi:hypothetical protein
LRRADDAGRLESAKAVGLRAPIVKSVADVLEDHANRFLRDRVESLELLSGSEAKMRRIELSFTDVEFVRIAVFPIRARIRRPRRR